MATITLKGSSIQTSGSLPAIGTKAPDFLLTKSDLSDISLQDFLGKTIVLNIVPSLDTGVCAASARKFNTLASSMNNTVILTVSRDLPFAQKRFCEAEGIANVITLSELRNHDFGKAYGQEIITSPLAGLLARAVVIIDADGIVRYTQQVPEIAQEPDYDAVLHALAAISK